MNQPIAFRDGQFVPQHDLLIRPQDLGFMWGATVAEQLRTFGGRLFRPEQHLDRLSKSLRAIGMDVPVDSLLEPAREVIRVNSQQLSPDGDLGLTIFVTPGISPTYATDLDGGPTVGIHSYPLPFQLWTKKYDTGQACEISHIEQIPTSCWPRHLKSRSRMHYYLADQEVVQRAPDARAILLDGEGRVNEASTANVVAYFQTEGFVSPPLDAILPGISLRYVESLALKQEQPFTYRHLSADELQTADELLLTSTPFCVLPVSRLGTCTYRQRDQFENILAWWSQAVGVDIRKQAESSVR